MSEAGTRYIKPKSATDFFNMTVARLTKMGISVYGSRVLYVRGRTSGEWRTTPVNPLTLKDGTPLPGRPARQHPVGPQPAGNRLHRRTARRPADRAVQRDRDRRRRQARHPARVPASAGSGRSACSSTAWTPRPRRRSCARSRLATPSSASSRPSPPSARRRRSRRPACPSARRDPGRRPASRGGSGTSRRSPAPRARTARPPPSRARPT